MVLVYTYSMMSKIVKEDLAISDDIPATVRMESKSLRLLSTRQPSLDRTWRENWICMPAGWLRSSTSRKKKPL